VRQATSNSTGVRYPRAEWIRLIIDGPYAVALSEIMPNGQPQTTPVWCNRKGDCIFINVMKGFQKEKNMRQNSGVSILDYDPKNLQRSTEIRGNVVEMTEASAIEHNDELARPYLGKSDAKFFGDALPAEMQSCYMPIRVKIAPTHIRVEC
jgi:pyridoxamine 5'-phosphate oxidase-like protein